ncbi:hypothetical protein [Plebeiibacterium marinum]|uniref:Lipoprotein n=1 Tax=Plebeiibacterium marinum TaxID=2992111 RepID=A0AAE3MAQ2_9BACT|nr:hypothetical protein [Plebeiobacterium marinum]MCW3804225.1 hypothetical protein [Plebeiobacterium marinum]
MIKSILPAILMFLLISVSCQDNNSNNTDKENNPVKKNLELWADTIIYDVLIQNPDPTDEWQDQKIKHVNHKKLVDDIFSSIYTEKKIAYDYYSNQPYTIDEIREFEEGYPRTDIGKLQFEECWKYDQNTGNIEKQVYSILVAYTLYDSSQNIRGYKAGFYLKNE